MIKPIVWHRVDMQMHRVRIDEVWAEVLDRWRPEKAHVHLEFVLTVDNRNCSNDKTVSLPHTTRRLTVP